MAVPTTGSDISKLIRPYLPAAAGVLVGIVVITLFAIFDGPKSDRPAPEKMPVSRGITGQSSARPKFLIDRKALAERSAPFKLPQATTPIEPGAKPETEPVPPAALGLLPAKTDAEPPAWQRFAAVAPAAVERPLIAILIDDMGIDMPHSAEAVALPGPLTLSYLPYADQITRQVEGARRAGHELMVHVSMEPESGRPDPGPNVLSANLRAIEIIRRLDWALDRFSGFVGVNNHMGSRFTADAQAMELVLGEFKRRGLLFVDSRTTTRTVAPQVARRLNLPFAERDVFMDDTASAEVVAAQLLRTEEIARRTGSAIAIGHPREATLNTLRRWLPTLERRGFSLAPVSAVVMRRRQAP